MQKLVSFLEKSVEFIALGIAGVFMLLCVYWYVLTPPATAKVGGKPVGPGDIDDLISTQAVAPLAIDVKQGPPEAVKPPDVLGPWTAAMTKAPPIQIASDRVDSFGEHGVATIKEGGPNVDLITAVAALPKAVPVSVQAGMSVAAPLKAANGQDVQGAAANDILWASAAFSVPAADVKAAFEKPLDKKDPAFAKFYRTAYLNVELQRQQAIGHDATGAPIFPNDNSFKVVEIPKVDQQDIQPLPDPKSSRDTKNSFAQWADTHEPDVRTPKFYTVVAGTPYSPAVLPGQAPAPGAAGAAAPAIAVAPARPVAPAVPALINPLAPAAGGQQQAGLDPLTMSADQIVWAHDDTVEAGRSYRYRVVYHMKNPVFALENIADPKILDQLDIASPPSDWSGPITIPVNVQYWVTALPRNGSAALVDYSKWEAGNWKMTHNMSLAAGDTIPGTDQTIVDIHYVQSPRPKEQYVLLSDSFGEPIRHYPKDDRDDPARKQREKDANPDNAAAGNGGRTGGAAPASTPRSSPPVPRGNR